MITPHPVTVVDGIVYYTTRAGHVFTVSESDRALVDGVVWCTFSSRRTRYVGRNIPDPLHPGKEYTIRLHREVLGLTRGQRGPDGKRLEGDHINHNGLDNTRRNLRIADPGQSTANRRGWERKVNPGLPKGVSVQANGRYQARTTFGYQAHLFGTFDTPEEAGAAAQEGRARLHREFACDERHPSPPKETTRTTLAGTVPACQVLSS